MKVRHLLVALAALLFSLPAAAQQEAAAKLFHRVTDAGVQVAVEININLDWHLYGQELGAEDAIGTTTTLDLSSLDATFYDVRFPKPHRTPMEYGMKGQPTWAWTHSGRIVLYSFGEWEDGPVDETDIYLTINGQTCSDITGMCIQYSEDLESLGAGSDALFADFPADLIPTPEKVVPAVDVAPSQQIGGGLGSGAFGYGANGHASATMDHRIVGSRIEVVVSLDVEDTWHLYGETVGAPDAIGKPTVVDVEAAGVTWDTMVFPEAHKTPQEYGMQGEPTWTWTHEGKFDVLLAGSFEGEAPTQVTGSIDGLTCSDVDGQCVAFETELTSSGKGLAAGFKGFPKMASATYIKRDPGPAADAADSNESAVAASATGSQPVQPEEKSSLWQFILLCVGGGIFTLLMPCTYPMIPITISFFAKQAEKTGKPPLSLSLAYGIGIIVMFEVIGFLVGPVIITFAQHWLTNAIIGVVFIYFAMVLLGIINLQPPRFLMNAAGGASQKGGFFGVFLMGATLVITSFTCTAPILGSILGAGGTETNYTELALGMGAFGLTMAIPFFVLSMIPGKLTAMPSAGEWMNTLKVTLGFIELAAALKFLSNWDLAVDAGLLPDELLLLAWIVILTAATGYLFGIIKLSSSSPGGVSPIRALFGTGFMFMVGYMVIIMCGYPRGDVMAAFLPGYSNGSIFGKAGLVSSEGETLGHTIIEDDYEAAVALALSEDKLLLVNLTGIF